MQIFAHAFQSVFVFERPLATDFFVIFGDMYIYIHIYLNILVYSLRQWRFCFSTMEQQLPLLSNLRTEIVVSSLDFRNFRWKIRAAAIYYILFQVKELNNEMNFNAKHYTADGTQVHLTKLIQTKTARKPDR